MSSPNPAFQPLDRAKTAKLLRQDDAKTLIQYLQQRIVQEHNQVEGAGDLLNLGRSQGRIEILKQMLKFREE